MKRLYPVELQIKCVGCLDWMLVKSCPATQSFVLHSLLLTHIIMAHFCLELWFHHASHLTVMPAGTASRKRVGVLTTYYLIVPAHLTHHTNIHTYTSIKRAEPLPPIHHLFHHHELGMRFVPSENAGGRWETEAVRKRWGETSQKPPAAHA